MENKEINDRNHPGRMSAGISALLKTKQTPDKSFSGWTTCLNCHSRVSLSGISALEKTKVVEVPDNNTRVRQYHKAFTLIELLVVVLIIGILAAIALPQYERAVVKARVGTILPLMATLQNAEEVYYLNNGNYTNDVSALDVEIPAVCAKIAESSTEFTCGKYFLLGVYDTGQISVNYCPGYNQNFESCKDERTVHIAFRPYHIGKNFSEAERGQRECKVYHDSVLAKAVCASLGLKTEID